MSLTTAFTPQYSLGEIGSDVLQVLPVLLKAIRSKVGVTPLALEHGGSKSLKKCNDSTIVVNLASIYYLVTSISKPIDKT